MKLNNKDSKVDRRTFIQTNVLLLKETFIGELQNRSYTERLSFEFVGKLETYTVCRLIFLLKVIYDL